MAAITEHSGPSPAGLAVRPTGGGVGAEVAGIDLRSLDAGTFAAIRRAFVEHSVLLFRGQRLSDDDLIAFSRRFGALDQAPVQVAITSQEDRHVLAVPVSALLARPGGGYAIQVRRGASTQLVAVTTGLFDDVAGRVEISAPNLRAGMRVVVPAG